MTQDNNNIPTNQSDSTPKQPTTSNQVPHLQPVRPQSKVGKMTAALVLTGVLSAGVGGLAGAGTVATLTADKASVVNTSEGKETTSKPSKGTHGSATEVIRNSLPSIVTINVSSEAGSGTGSGVVIEDGYIVTNAHVVNLGGATDKGTAVIQTYTGETAEAEIVAVDATSDLAVLKTDLKLPAIKIASSNDVEVGDETIAIGSPLGLSGTVTTGIVSALNRPITVQSSEVADTSPFPTNIALNVLQTDAAINSGNSGGALLNSEGELIGINVAIASTNDKGGNIGVGFAIPSDYVKEVTTALIKEGEVNHGFIGVNIEDNLAENGFVSGVRIVNVEPGTPAEEAGLKPGDVVKKVDGQPMTSTVQFVATVKQALSGEELTLTVDRDGTEKEIMVETTTEPEETA